MIALARAVGQSAARRTLRPWRILVGRASSSGDDRGVGGAASAVASAASSLAAVACVYLRACKEAVGGKEERAKEEVAPRKPEAPRRACFSLRQRHSSLMR